MTATATHHHGIVTTRIEELSCHHHLLLIRVSIWCFALVDQIKQVSLVGSSVLMANSTCSSNSVMADARCCGTESTRSTGVSIVLSHHRHIISLSLSREVSHLLIGMTGIALPQLRHKVSIKHCLAHLSLLVGSHLVGAAMIAAGPEAADSRLIEHLVLVALTVDSWEHVVDA